MTPRWSSGSFRRADWPAPGAGAGCGGGGMGGSGRSRAWNGIRWRLRPRRSRCAGCGRTHVLLPVRCLVRRADAAGRSGARGPRLGALLDAGPRRLLVLDDVWDAEQLAPFTQGGMECARLVTTRVPELLAGRGTAVRVDQMSPEQAQALLTAGLPRLDEAVVAGLLAVTGRWPLLLRLVGKILANAAQARQRRDGADLGRGHRTGTGHPHRPRRRGVRGGDRAGWQLAGHRRQRRRDGADLGRGHRARNGPSSPATPVGCTRWRSRRMAAG